MKTSTARVQRWRALRREGKRCVRLDVEIAPGIRVTAVEIDEAACEDSLVEAGILRLVDCDFPQLVDEGVAIFLASLRRWRKKPPEGFSTP